MVLETVGSSKASNIRALLIRAWRERWSDMQWGIHIKTVLPRYISGDIYHLSDCILQQALLGPLPNHLILSYLRHSLAAHIVSYGGVLESISKHDSLHKSHCVAALLDLLASTPQKVTCRGKPEDCLMLAVSLVAAVRWLLKVVLHAISRPQASEQVANLKTALQLLQEFLKCQFLKGLLYIAKLEDPALWNQVLSIVSEIENKHASSSYTPLPEFKDTFHKIFNDLNSLNPVSPSEPAVRYNPSITPICYGLHARIMVEAVMHSTQSSQSLAAQLVLYRQLRGLTEKGLYLELLVSCFLGLGSEEEFPHQQLQWVGFTFIKLPSVIQYINSGLNGITCSSSSSSSSASSSSASSSEALIAAVREFVVRTCLLDVADRRMNCNCLEYLLHELVVRTSLLTEQDAAAAIALRKDDPMAVCVVPGMVKEGSSSHMAIPDLILRAQPTVSSILKNLSNKNQESVLQVMNLLISGKSRDLLLTAAAASGKLFIYAQKFVKFNQQSLEPQPGETEAMAKNRALMFDLTFLLLCHIAQVYGVDVVAGEERETFVEGWMRCNMPEKGRHKMITPQCRTDTSHLVEVMQQINAPDMAAKYGKAFFAKVCRASPHIMQKLTSEVLQGSVSLPVATELLDRMCSHLCSLPICIAAWTCSYLQEVSSSHGATVNALLCHLQSNFSNQEPSLTLGSFKDRALLMSDIIENMVKITKESIVPDSKEVNIQSSFYSFFYGGIPGEMDLMECSSSNDHNLSEELDDAWKNMFRQCGILTHSSLWTFERLLRLGGHKWFVLRLLQCSMESVFETDLNRAMDLIYGILQMDLQQCCTALLLDTIIHYLNEPGSVALLSHRRIGALARLTVQVLAAAWAAALPPPPTTVGEAATSQNPTVNPTRKRSFAVMSEEDSDERLLRRMGTLALDPSSLSGISREGVGLMIAVQTLLNALMTSLPNGVVSPVTELVVALLQELLAAPVLLSPLLTLLPPNLLSVLLALYPPTTFTPSHLLSLALPTPSTSLPSPLTPSQEAAARRAAAKILCTHRNFVLAAESTQHQAVVS
ncbi:Mediator complex subunit Med24 N-terminal [Trinorchestia longiramus]|nr:Mediator complex subunit Med24 N-terminal [Trinorchestia longiramus]